MVTFITYPYKNIQYLLFLLVICACVLTNVRIFIKFNLIPFLVFLFQWRQGKSAERDLRWKTMMNTKVCNGNELQTVLCNFCSSACFYSKHFALLMSDDVILCALVIPLQVLIFQINLLSNLNILRFALGDLSISGNIKQAFL